MKRMWKVGELARLTGLTVRTLQYYDQIGLLAPSGGSESGRRLYTEADMAKLQQLLSLKALGLPLEDVKSVLEGGRLGLAELVSLQISRTKQHLLAQQKLLRQLEHASGLLAGEEALSVEEFTKLLEAMRRSQETFFAKRQATLEGGFDRLDELLRSDPVQSSKRED